MLTEIIIIYIAVPNMHICTQQITIKPLEVRLAY